ncbi:MAG TPA: PIG-L family deacetylase [Gemmatimonadaceae bacterium]|nr:PIG-L family deacetylase [Gemmatimonadaceae bacterium]
MRTSINTLVAVTLATVIPLSAQAQIRRPVVAVFAHPDDERIIGPLLSRLAREGRETHLVIATDGSKGVRDFARMPAGAELAAARTTQIVQSDARYANVDLLYASLPTERLRTAARANPTVNGMAEALLTVRVPFEERDLAAGREEFACHRTQYTPTEMAAVNAYLAHAWNGNVWLRPWNGTLRDPEIFR